MRLVSYLYFYFTRIIVIDRPFAECNCQENDQEPIYKSTQDTKRDRNIKLTVFMHTIAENLEKTALFTIYSHDLPKCKNVKDITAAMQYQ